MKVKVEANLPSIERQVKNLKKLPMLKTGLKAQELNDDQISKGIDNKGRKMKSYTKAYADKEKEGSRQPVNLVLSGRMMQNFGVIRTARDKVIVGFSSLKERLKAKGLVSGGKNRTKEREFVGLSKKNRQKLLTFFYRIISKGV